MAKTCIDKKARKALLEARNIIQTADRAECNEADTRLRVVWMFGNLMGYDTLKHLSGEHVVQGAGEIEHCDLTIQLPEGETVKPKVMVEIKRISIDLARKHLGQVASYAINAGCEWILLTNAKEWQLHHVSFRQPPITTLICDWNILKDDIEVLAERFELISYKNLKKGGLDDVWRATNVLDTRNLLQAVLSHDSLNIIRRELRKYPDSGVLLSPEQVVGGIRSLLNETALLELEKIRISLPKKTPKKAQEKKRAECERLASSTPLVSSGDSGRAQSKATRTGDITIRETIIKQAVEILEKLPQGIRYSDFVRQVQEALPQTSNNTIQGVIWNLQDRVPQSVVKPGRGKFLHTKYRSGAGIDEM